MASSCSPHSIVENEDFKYFLKLGIPNYTMPSLDTLNDKLIPSLYRNAKDIVIENVSKAPYVSLTTDVWTTSTGRHFIGITCLIINDSFQLESYALTCREADDSHTAENVKTLLEEVIAEFKINKSKIVAITTDIAPHIVSAVSMLQIDHVPCFAHCVNFFVTKLLEHSTLKPLIDKFKGIYNMFAHSDAAKHALSEIQTEKGLPVESMPSANPTRWWSVLNQMHFITTHNEALGSFFGEHNNISLTIDPAELRIVNQLVILLDRLRLISETMSSETDVTASAILRSSELIREAISERTLEFTDPTYGELCSLRTCMRELSASFDTIFKNATLSTSLIDMASFVDLRLKSESNIQNHELENLIRLSAKDIRVESTPSTTSYTSILSFLFGSREQETELHSHDPVEEELGRYRCEPRVSYAIDILHWWKLRRAMYPILSEIARKYLTVSATCVATEQVSRCCGSTKLRLTMKDEHDEQIIFIAKNKHKIPRQSQYQD